ncbi:accessory gland protein acp29ab-like [Plakobranchus ocellatus]|uniref:Accessory gland protein acp29ab-like n=1 Tax=Plakobranchus ocellatus TaxID=259542 RepID=A0AAV4BBC0_9GAST|nr:accessory gland protein acp29ab-like [Plakobranchus ocellatus]
MSRQEADRDSHFQGLTMGELKQLDRVFRLRVPRTQTITTNRLFKGYLCSLPVAGFNSGKYDINDIKPYLIRHLSHEDVDITNEVRDEDVEEEAEHVGEGGSCLQRRPIVVKRNNQYLCIGSRAFKELEQIIGCKTLLADIRQGSPLKQTFALEAYHKVMCGFAPKFHHFFYRSMKSSVLLAALHTNENVERPQASGKDGSLHYAVHYPKADGGNAVCATKSRQSLLMVK